MKTLFILLSLLISASGLYGQESDINAPNLRTWVAFEYGANGTFGALAERYGFLNHVGLMTGVKTKGNLFFGLNSTFLFGNTVRLTEVFDHLTDSYGNITDINGDIAAVVVFPRGFSSNLTFGKVFSVLSPNPNSGVFIHGGVGYLLHK